MKNIACEDLKAIRTNVCTPVISVAELVCILALNLVDGGKEVIEVISL